MKTGTIKFLGIATIIVAAGAWYASSSRAADTRADARDTYAIPELRDNDTLNNVGSVSVTTNGGTVTLERGEQGWTLQEKNGYEAKPDRVRELLFALRDARILDAKTSDRAKFGRLGLEEPDTEGATSKRVVIKSRSGETIADVLIGDSRAGKGGFSPGQSRPDGQTYLHPAGDGPALLVNGSFRADARTNGWLEQEFLNVDQSRIKAARVKHADGETVTVARADMGSSALEILDMPAGMQAKVPDGTRAFVSSLSRLRFDDVVTADSIQWGGEGAATIEFFTEHGLRVTADTVELPKEDEEVAEGAEPTMVTWARFRADVVATDAIPAAREAEAMGPAAPAAEGANEAEEAAASGPSAEELEREAQGLNESVGPWAIQLPSWKSGPFRMRQEGLMEPIPAPEPVATEADETTPEEASTAGESPEAPPGEDGGL